MSRGSGPNIVIVLMDCVRVDDFDAVVSDPGTAPFLHRLRDSCARFGRAVAPGTWTMPSHASLFTGYYPWEHGAHFKSGTVLDARYPTIAEQLAGRGYATATFSANPLIQPALGLTRGFSRCAWGGEREFYVRLGPDQPPTCPDLSSSAGPWLPGHRKRHAWVYPTAGMLASLSPVGWDAANRLASRIVARRAGNPAIVSAWIEPEIEAWVRTQPPDRPLFVFVNLLEAHEPYLPEGGRATRLRELVPHLWESQYPSPFLQGIWHPGRRQVDWAHRAYRRTIETIDARVHNIATILDRCSRWDDTVLFLTSDHGQAFLERDLMYHRFRVDDEVTRIPLWMRVPGNELGGTGTDGWVSLIDIPRTIADLVGIAPFGGPDAVSLLDTLRRPSDRAVHCFSEGMDPGQASRSRERIRRLLDRFQVATYHRDWKATATLGASTVVSQVDAPSAPGAAPESAGSEVRKLAEEALRTASSRVAACPPGAPVLRRLAGWGY